LQGNLIETFSDIPKGGRDTFLGVVSVVPIGSIQFDESAEDKDVISLRQLVFGVGPADLLEGMPFDLQLFFWGMFNLFIVFMLVSRGVVPIARCHTARSSTWCL
jgi:hypothetical protein